MKKFRFLIYEGPETWIEKTFQRNAVQGELILSMDGSGEVVRSIKEITSLSELEGIVSRMVQQKELDSSISPEEAI